MKIVLVGARGTIGSEVVKTLSSEGHEVIPVGRNSGEFRADISDRASIRALFESVGPFDALVSAAGDVAFAPLKDLTAEKWTFSLENKLLGQIQLVQEALPFIRENGSFTLISGILSEDPIYAGVAATTVNRALEGFVQAAAIELPKNLRINIVSPTVLKESEQVYGAFFPGFIPVEGWKVAQAYKRSILGAQTGQIYRVC